MDTRTLAILEEAVEPYRRAGFVITYQSEGAITLAYPRERFSYLLFITLLLIWPLAVLYLVFYNTQREKSVCVRVTSQGYVEESGYTLQTRERDRRRTRVIAILSVVCVVAVLILLTMLVAYPTR